MIPRFRLVSLSHSRSYGSVLGLGESCAPSKSSLGCRLIQMTLALYLNPCALDRVAGGGCGNPGRRRDPVLHPFAGYDRWLARSSARQA